MLLKTSRASLPGLINQNMLMPQRNSVGLKQVQVQVTTPEGKKTIGNPFYNYKFKSKENLFPVNNKKEYFVGAKETIRGVPLGPLEPTNEEQSEKDLQGGEGAFTSRRESLWSYLAKNDNDYNQLSKDIEKIHGSIHTGVSGFMWGVPWAGWDPVFWLHHANIDRFVAMWQAANPGIKLAPETETVKFQMVDSRTQIDLDTPLLPFKHSDGSWWTSKDISNVRTIWDSGYGYPEVSCQYKSKTDKELDALATAQINNLYLDDIQPEKRIKKREEAESIIQWTANVVVDQSELPGTFQILVFLGEPPANSQEWSSCDEKLGDLTVFGSPGEKMPSKIVTTSIGLTAILQKKGLGTNATEIDNYLASNLVWKCLDEEQRPVDVKNLPTLKVGVTNNRVDIPAKASEKATFFRPKLRVKGTRRKKGGVTNLDDLKKPELKNGARKTIGGSFASITVADTPASTPTVAA
ncbi:Tyrosinase [Dactylellina cionopaga]|nr:Tyrosinase [Dactylellina cionopaga]